MLRRYCRWCQRYWALAMSGMVVVGGQTAAAESPAVTARLVARYCHDCHAGEAAEADIDLAAFASAGDLERRTKLWQRVGRVLAEGDMPPRDSEQPTAEERQSLLNFVQGALATEAAKQAGDPGRVVLRRLSNAEYTFTVRDLTAVPALDPAREFPVDGAAGEGFTNTGQALVMSPTLVTKYLDAAKGIAAHAILLPDGLRFSAGAERGDQIDEALGQLREFYARFSVSRGDVPLTTEGLQGIPVDPGHEGFLPVDRYLERLLVNRARLRADPAQIAAVAGEHGLSAKYLRTLWNALEANDGPPSLLLHRLRAAWRRAEGDAAAVAAEVRAWQERLWQFNKVGMSARRFGLAEGTGAWAEPATPVSETREFRVPLGESVASRRLVLHAGDAGDGGADDVVVWKSPRIAAPGNAEISLRDAIRMAPGRDAVRAAVVATAERCLTAIDVACRGTAGPPGNAAAWEQVARDAGLDPHIVSAWAMSLGLQAGPTAGGDPICGPLLTKSADAYGGHARVAGWLGEGSLAVVSNPTAADLKLPGLLGAGRVAVHPAAKRQVVLAWRAAAAGDHAVEAEVLNLDVGCGLDGVDWRVEIRRGGLRLPLAAFTNVHRKGSRFASAAPLPLWAGDMVCLVVGPGGHESDGCDLSAVDLRVTAGERRWDLAADVAATIGTANPHADGRGDADVWHFASEPTSTAGTVPADSVLARWIVAPSAAARRVAAAEVAAVLAGAPPKGDSPDGRLRAWLLGGASPLLAAVISAAAGDAVAVDDASVQFGRPLDGLVVGPEDLVMSAPAALEIPLPDDLDGTLIFTAGLHRRAGPEATAQVHAAVVTGDTPAGAWADLVVDHPFLARPGTAGQARLERAFADHRALLPPVVCYGRIVPVDEVITFNIVFRDDDRLRSLMLEDDEARELDRLWDELLFVSREPLEIIDVYSQLLEYMTQGAVDHGLSAGWKAVGPVLDARAEDFRRRLLEAEPAQVDAVVALAARAYRRPLSPDEMEKLRGQYAAFRSEGLEHEAAVRLLIARVLVAPEFLYKIESPGPGREAAPVSDHELATRLGYFLWSSLPDAELARDAAAGRLHEPAVLTGQLRRMVADPKIRRLAEQFGTHWLHVENFAEHDEKSPQAFPEFADLREAMHEEAVLLFVDLFQQNRPIRGLLDADRTFLNEPLAGFYGIPGVEGPEWRLVEGVHEHGRGGVLTLAAALAKQSGASRTSPILRGTWITEVLLGQRVPKPPQGVPPLAEALPAGLSERALTALHSQDAACASCHARFDAYGFALEAFDAIGRRRELDAAGKPVDTAATLPDGTPVAGHADLAHHLTAARGADFVRQFCKKLLGYALGRETQLSDLPLLEAIDSRLEAADGRVMAALEAIVTSPQFLEIRGTDAAGDE